MPRRWPLPALLLGLWLGLAAGAALAAGIAFPPLTGRVVDAAHVLPADEIARLEAALAAHEAKTTNQVVVATVPSLQGNDIESYANALFRTWALGLKDKDNGVLFLIAPNEREMRIEVGYGLEGTLTDALASQIIRNIVTPHFREGDLPGGIEAGTNAILTVLGGGALPEETGDQGDWRDVVPFLIFFLVWMFFVANARRRGGRGGGIWWGGGGGGFGGGSGGGFGGGGGSSGGGGASGRW
ncbi:MAG TPA: TPM domain-containing protein [Parvibaculum sp.]|uniref:TPM domain-containing protein n=1 Tax=Parvibaculum sp. TaxID=2024848 RepID=UPI002C8D915B|nr:TPM domain-containing protein [Parvibaculum sp.]HMM14952.1 TPM domain-containing protein [Parvibaculum sp.]